MNVLIVSKMDIESGDSCMELSIESLKKYIIDNIEGTDDDNRFIENLSNIALVKNEDIDEYKNYVEYNIKQIRKYIEDKNNKEKNGIKAIEDIFGFINEFNFQKEDGNFYLFVGNVKIKAVALLCRMYVFIKKYYTHTEEESKQRRKSTINDIKEYIKENKDIDKFLKLLIEKDNESDKIEYYLLSDQCYELKKKTDEKSNCPIYKMSPKCKESAQIICDLINDKLELCNVDDEKIGKIIRTIKLISDKKIENRIAEFEEQEKMSDLLKKKKIENQSLRYFLFDNSMKEVEFLGVENRFNWLWEQEEKVCLYRNVIKKEKNSELEEKKSYEYMKSLMKHIVEHASGTNCKNAISYSRNPIRDFYKYIDLQEDPCKFNFTINIKIENDSVNVELSNDFNHFEVYYNVVAGFEFIKGATTNSLKITKDNTTKEVSFYAYLKKSEEDYDNTQFCIEYCKENSIVPAKSGRRLEKLNNYMHTWGIKKGFTLSRISENDDEVITSTGYFSNHEKKEEYELNIVQIWAVMYELYYLENPPEENIMDNLKRKIKDYFIGKNNIRDIGENVIEKIGEKVQELLKKGNKSIELNLKGNINVKIQIKNMNNFAEQIPDQIAKQIAEQTPKKIAEQIGEQIAETVGREIKQLKDDELVKNTIEAIKEGVQKKETYKNARKEKFDFYSENNKIIKFWKALFKSV